MPHLNQLIEENSKQGFDILCVTSEPKAPTETFVSETGLRATIALVSEGENSKLMDFYGAKGYPSAALVNPKGDVVWTGHPSEVNAALIKEHIKGARTGSPDGSLTLDLELPKKWSSAAKSMAKGDLGRGLSAIDKALDDQDLDAGDRSQLEAAKKDAMSIFDGNWGTAETALSEQRYYDAMAALEPLIKHFKNHELGDRAKDKHKELKGNKELRDEIEAGRRIAGALEEIAAEKADKAEKSLKGILNGPLKDTNEAKRAQAILDGLSK